MRFYSFNLSLTNNMMNFCFTFISANITNFCYFFSVPQLSHILSNEVQHLSRTRKVRIRVHKLIYKSNIFLCVPQYLLLRAIFLQRLSLYIFFLPLRIYSHCFSGSFSLTSSHRPISQGPRTLDFFFIQYSLALFLCPILFLKNVVSPNISFTWCQVNSNLNSTYP